MNILVNHMLNLKNIATLLSTILLEMTAIAAPPNPLTPLPATAPTTPTAYLLCNGQNANQNCLLVDASGKLLSAQLIEWAGHPHEKGTAEFIDGMLLFGRDVPYKTNGGPSMRYGYVNTLGQEIVPPIYIQANPFSEGLARVCTDQGCGYINTQGKLQLPIRPEWQTANDFHDGRALVRGAADIYGNDPVPNGGVYALSSRGPFAVEKPWTVIDKNGNTIFGPDQKELMERGRPKVIEFVGTSNFHAPRIDGDFSAGVAPFLSYARDNSDRGNDKRYGLLDINGKVVVPAIYLRRLEPLNGAFTVAERFKDNKSADGQLTSEKGLLNAKGVFTPYVQLFKPLVGVQPYRPEFEHVEGYTVLNDLGSKAVFALLNTDAKITYVSTGRFKENDNRVSEGLLPVSFQVSRLAKKGEYFYDDRKGYRYLERAINTSDYYQGYIYPNGTLAMQNKKFTQVHAFSEGLAAVKKFIPVSDGPKRASGLNALGFIDRQGDWVIKPKFSEIVRKFKGGRAVVEHSEMLKDGFVGPSSQTLIDTQGRILATFASLVGGLKPRPASQ